MALASPLITDSVSAHENHEEKQAEAVILAPGYQALNFDAPAVGSYALPIIKSAGDGSVITHSGEATSIYEMLDNRLGIVSFIYTSCNDVNGCPLASFVLSKIDKRIQDNPLLRGRVQLLSISFDYQMDTIERLGNYAKGFANQTSEWKFLRATSAPELDALLRRYDQSIVVEPDGSTISHILRVFLVDAAKNIRNVYSVSFLHADTLINDLLTLLGEFEEQTPAPIPSPADLEKGEYGNYPVASQALTYGSSKKMDLHVFSAKQQLGLPKYLEQNDEGRKLKIELGKRLFFDRRLSLNDTISCAMCHIPEQGFTSNELATAIGIEGRTVRRNTPTILNIAFMQRLFHDAREYSLENQVWSPLLATNEMANPSIGFVLEKLTSIEEYNQLFTDAFPRHGLTMQSLGEAIAAYEKSLKAADSKVDELLFGTLEKPDNQLSLGLKLFTGKAGCASCHTISAQDALFTDQQLHNTGIGYLRSMGEEKIFQNVLIAPGQTIEVHKDDIGPSALDKLNDLGRYEITEDPADRWKYRTPTLRNVALTAPYMHNGSLASLRDVIDFYDRGGIPNPELDPLIKPLGLSTDEKNLLIYFLNNLTSPHAKSLIEDARATPIGERP